MALLQLFVLMTKSATTTASSETMVDMCVINEYVPRNASGSMDLVGDRPRHMACVLDTAFLRVSLQAAGLGPHARSTSSSSAIHRYNRSSGFSELEISLIVALNDNDILPRILLCKVAMKVARPAPRTRTRTRAPWGGSTLANPFSRIGLGLSPYYDSASKSAKILGPKAQSYSTSS